MDPWQLIGWLILTGFVTALVLFASAIAWRVTAGWRMARHIAKTDAEMLTITPTRGQVWKQDGTRLNITNIYDNGRIGISTGISSWSDSPEEWAKRVRSRNLRLVKS